MTPAELAREIAAGQQRPAYLVAGAESLLRDEAVAAVRRAALGEAGADFDADRLDGERASAGELLDALRTLPVLAPRRFVWLREPEARGSRSEALVAALPEAIETARKYASVVLVVTAAKVDKRSRWVKAFAAPAAFVACDPPKGTREAAAFVTEEAERRGITLADGAAEALADAVGPQLQLLRHELEKASLFAGPGKPVKPQHVRETASSVAEEPIWDLTDAIGEGRSADALAVLGRLLAQGAPPPVVLGSLASHFRKLTKLRHGGRVDGHPFALRKLETQARRYTPARLVSCLGAIHAVDEVLKGQGALDPELALERLVLGLA